MGIMATPKRDPKTGRFSIRIGVPEDVRHIIGKRELKKSLGTSDEREANIKALPFKQEAYSRIERARRELAGTHDVNLTTKDCSSIAERWYARVRADIETTGDVSAFMTYGDFVDEDGNEVKQRFGLADTLSIQGSDIRRATDEQLNVLAEELEPFIAEQLTREGLIVPKGSISYHQLVRSFHKYIHHLDRLCFERVKENWSYEPVRLHLVDHQVQAVSNGAAMSKSKPQNAASEVFKRFKASRLLHNQGDSKVEKTVNETEFNVGRLISLLGDKDITEFTSADFVNFRDTLLELPKDKSQKIRSLSVLEQVEKVRNDGLQTLSKAVVKRNFNLVSSFFTFAVELGLISDNPALKVKPPKITKKTEVEEDRGFSPEEVSKLFKLPLFNKPTEPKKYGLTSYWVPLLCRYTGARSGEILQLRKADITVDPDGIHYINVRRGTGQYVKNNSSLRHIPIHDHLIELGFLDYVSKADEWLFPEVPLDRYGSKVPYFTKWWKKVIEDQGIEVAQPTHAFRHTFKTELRTIGTSDKVNDSITGHASGSVGDRYGTVYMQTKLDVINQIPKLDLKRIF